MLALAACAWIVAVGGQLSLDDPGRSHTTSPELVSGQAPEATASRTTRAPQGEFWLKQIDKYGIWAPLALGLLLWILGLMVIVVQAWTAVRERARIATENDKTKQLLLELAEELEQTLSRPRS